MEKLPAEHLLPLSIASSLSETCRDQAESSLSGSPGPSAPSAAKRPNHDLLVALSWRFLAIPFFLSAHYHERILRFSYYIQNDHASLHNRVIMLQCPESSKCHVMVHINTSQDDPSHSGIHLARSWGTAQGRLQDLMRSSSDTHSGN